LPDDYKVYLFYYPGSMPNEDLENKLRKFGNIIGKNLFVNIGRLNDPNYKKIASRFEIRDLPVIIITAPVIIIAIDGLSSVKTERYYSTFFVRLGSKILLHSVDLTIKSIERLFNLFIGGQISEALSQYRHDQRNAFLSKLKVVILNSLKVIAKFLSDRDISISLLEGKFELKRSE
jgi:hypothetical protein